MNMWVLALSEISTPKRAFCVSVIGQCALMNSLLGVSYAALINRKSNSLPLLRLQSQWPGPGTGYLTRIPLNPAKYSVYRLENAHVMFQPYRPPTTRAKHNTPECSPLYNQHQLSCCSPSLSLVEDKAMKRYGLLANSNLWMKSILQHRSWTGGGSHEGK